MSNGEPKPFVNPDTDNRAELLRVSEDFFAVAECVAATVVSVSAEIHYSDDPEIRLYPSPSGTEEHGTEVVAAMISETFSLAQNGEIARFMHVEGEGVLFDYYDEDELAVADFLDLNEVKKVRSWLREDPPDVESLVEALFSEGQEEDRSICFERTRSAIDARRRPGQFWSIWHTERFRRAFWTPSTSS